MSVNPNPIYLWNHRQKHLLNPCLTTTDTDGTFLEQEQVLTQIALQRNPKAYGAWFHRKWSIRHHLQKNVDNDLDSNVLLQW